MTVLPHLFPDWRPEWLLHEDADLIVVDKPAGLSTHAPDAARHDDCVSRLKAFLAVREGRPPGEVYLGIHQRLDRDTSGVLLFARRSAANPALAVQFEGHRVRKTYLAVVSRPRGTPREGTLEHRLLPARSGTMRATPASSRPRHGPAGQLAITRFRELERQGDRTLLELRPETGRTHQIRAQCAAAGWPLAGDPLYGGEPAPRLMLHALSLELEHPTGGRHVRFVSPRPAALTAWLHGYAETRDLPGLLRQAADRRYALGTDPDLTAFRWAHDGDGLDGVVVDLYGEHAVAQFYGAEGDDRLLDALASLGVAGVYVKFRPRQANVLADTRREALAPAHALRGRDAPAELAILEKGLRYLVRLGDGLSTGLFLDQRENRARVRDLSAGCTVLNLFAYTCGFTVAAAAGGAARTVSVDLSAGALAWGRRNLQANGLDGPQHVLVPGDVFAWLAGARVRRDRFDLVILDPPSYSSSHGSVFSESGYRDLARQAFEVVARGGRLLACSNHRGIPRARFRRYLHEAARLAGRPLAQLRDLPDPVDFPPSPGRECHLKVALARLADTPAP